jgi:hypothetical protein
MILFINKSSIPLVSACKKTHYFPVFDKKCQMLGIFTALKTKEFTLVNDCFQCKNNEADGVFWQMLVICLSNKN